MPGISYFQFMNTLRATGTALIYFTCMYPLTGIPALTPPPFYSCTDYHCDEGETVSLSAQQWSRVRGLFAAPRSPAEERRQIRKAIALLEVQIGGITGTSHDLAKNVAGAGQPGQLDCISESKNTTTYLQLLNNDGLLHWHTVEERRLRHPWILDLHWAAVIRDKNSGKRYAVDSWFLDNGQPPYIQPLDQWLSGRAFDSGQEQLGNQ
ncbi:MAG: hypothetical protein BMS9Abin08_0194 [Gammaproteobacteria bacterium]|nr:MAG: hypothetical protein BMS9Abin08_0194 [Gammaproteobacteria bacterium]